MSRPLRIQYPNAFYHITNRGNNRQNIFFKTDKDMDLFLDVLSSAKMLYGINVLAYCLMHNHYHLLIQTPRANLSRVMQYIGGKFTTKLNITHKRDGHLFRGRYKSVLVEEESYLRNIIRYIHLNPVKANLVLDPFNWKYSSHKDLMNSFEEENGSFLDTSLSRSLFGSDFKTYVGFIQAGVDELTEKFFTSKKLKPIFGSEETSEMIKSQVNVQEEVEFFKEYNQAKLVPEIMQNTSLAFTSSALEISQSQRGKTNYARSILICLLKEKTNMTHKDIAKTLSQKSPYAVKTALYQFKKDLPSNPEIKQLYESLKLAASHLTT